MPVSGRVYDADDIGHLVELHRRGHELELVALRGDRRLRRGIGATKQVVLPVDVEIGHGLIFFSGADGRIAEAASRLPCP